MPESPYRHHNHHSRGAHNPTLAGNFPDILFDHGLVGSLGNSSAFPGPSIASVGLQGGNSIDFLLSPETDPILARKLARTLNLGRYFGPILIL